MYNTLHSFTLIAREVCLGFEGTDSFRQKNSCKPNDFKASGHR